MYRLLTNFKTVSIFRSVFDNTGREHKIEMKEFDPPLTYVEGIGYVQIFEESNEKAN